MSFDRRFAAIVGAVFLATVGTVSLIVLAIMERNVEEFAPLILGFTAPTVTALLVYGTTDNRKNDDNQGGDQQ